METIDFPDVFTGTLDDEALERLLDDVASAAELIEVRLKGGASALADEADLATARQALRSGQAMGLQLRYVHQGRPWLDTLLRSDGGYRLVRMAVPVLTTTFYLVVAQGPARHGVAVWPGLATNRE